jgi:hypothetical protein
MASEIIPQFRDRTASIAERGRNHSASQGFIREVAPASDIARHPRDLELFPRKLWFHFD